MISIDDPTKSRQSLAHKLDMPSPKHLPTEDSFYSDYQLHANPIGYGVHGEVWLCNKKANKKLRAVKIVAKSTLPSLIIEDEQIQKAMKKVKGLNSAHLVKLYKIYENRNGYYLVTEYVPGGDLFDFIERNGFLIESQAANILRQLLEAISILRDSNQILNDVKPQNILFSDVNRMEIKLNPLNLFGVIRDVPDDTTFLSREIIMGKNCEKADSWSVGIVLYYMLSGKLPDSGEGEFSVKSIPMEFFSNISSKAANLVVALLQGEPSARIGIRDALNHSWIIAHSNTEDIEIVV